MTPTNHRPELGALDPALATHVARAAAAYIEKLAVRRGADARLDGLVRTFGEATRLEADFWQQGLDAV